MAHGCDRAGEFRAPMGRNRLNQYYWFCLDHVRAYNATWDYFKGMSQAEIEAELRGDVTWHRPSWPLGINAQIYDPLGLMGEEAQARREERRPRPATPEGEALAQLGLPHDASFAEVKSRYKTLVKRLHPDANGGDKEAEERLKTINQAYSTLKASFVQAA